MADAGAAGRDLLTVPLLPGEVIEANAFACGCVKRGAPRARARAL